MSTEDRHIPEYRIIHETAQEAKQRRQRFDAAMAEQAVQAAPRRLVRPVPMTARVFLWAAEAEVVLVGELPSERCRLMASGAITIATGLLVGLGLTLGLVDIGVFPLWAGLVGALIALLNVLLDRSWLAAVWIRPAWSRVTWLLAFLVRAMFSLLLGALVGTSLVMRIFKPEIERVTGSAAGLLERLTALQDLGQGARTIELAYLSLILLFAMNVLLPVLVGALSAVGPPSLYSRVLRAQREVDEARALATIRVEATRRALDPESESVVRRSGET